MLLKCYRLKKEMDYGVKISVGDDLHMRHNVLDPSSLIHEDCKFKYIDSWRFDSMAFVAIDSIVFNWKGQVGFEWSPSI